MDKKSLLAVLLITVVIILLPTYYKMISDPDDRPVYTYEPQISDTIETDITEEEKMSETPIKEPEADVQKSTEKTSTNDIFKNQTKNILINYIETPLISVELTSLGGGNISAWQLKQYQTWTEEKVKIIDPDIKNGLFLNFITLNGEKIDLNQFNFEPIQKYPKTIKIEENGRKELVYTLELGVYTITKKLIIYGDLYHFDLSFDITNPSQILLNSEYQIGWTRGLPSNEENISEDYTYSEAYASLGEEIENYSIDSENEAESRTINGQVDWIAVRTKYFLAAIIPKDVKTNGISFGGYGELIDEVIERRYITQMNTSKTAAGADKYSIYLGPLDNSILTDYESGLDEIILSHGWYERTFRSISLPIVGLLKFFYTFIPNYGIVIILFSILVKIVVYPLTKKSYKSMKEMSKVQPLLTELREKYKGDPQRLNRETMKLYKEHGINPLGGCLPMLLQLPLLAALFIVFRSTIQLRIKL